MKKPFSARVTAFTNAIDRRGADYHHETVPHTFTINTRISWPEIHIDRPVHTSVTSTDQARQLAKSLLAWADAKEEK